ncbi:MAG: geranylgeranylglycerol-phosphate geranylgeranyltransferase [Flavobacteriales bacterium]|jgi:4-hydroxybenzoate polyprenyltransferase|nr:geranylgeranylglycerol-phosphate geranylgeranyltransferase [Flavobacteriales bacterium]HOZ39527.1 geranylgeranylglycerol-phosphate geranylgeranyltransferase [Flavobacteriales bacterium]
MKDLITLSRPVNLLIIAATMVVMREGVVGGYLERGLGQLLIEDGHGFTRSELVLPEGFGPQLPIHLFILLVLSTVLIAAAGNIINDYFDTRIDRINKPGEVIVGRTVKRRVAMTTHVVLSGIGLVLGTFVAWRSGQLKWALIPAFAIGALWSYSTYYKRQLIIGNGLVATLTALVPLTVGLYEIPALQRWLSDPPIITMPNGEQYLMEASVRELWYFILIYTAFAFVSTLVRELQKDMADVRGDEAEGCHTVPIVWGMKWARGMTMAYIGLLIIGLLAIRMYLLRDPFSYWYIGIGVIGALLLSAGFTYQAQQRSEHVRAGQLMKLAMVLAIGFAVFIRTLP